MLALQFLVNPVNFHCCIKQTLAPVFIIAEQETEAPGSPKVMFTVYISEGILESS